LAKSTTQDEIEADKVQTGTGRMVASEKQEPVCTRYPAPAPL